MSRIYALPEPEMRSWGWGRTPSPFNLTKEIELSLEMKEAVESAKEAVKQLAEWHRSIELCFMHFEEATDSWHWDLLYAVGQYRKTGKVDPCYTNIEIRRDMWGRCL